MRRIWGFAAFILLGCAACSSSGTTGTPASTAPRTTAQPTVSAPPPSRSAPSSDPVHSSGYPAPPHPPKPTVPGDVPRTGPNTHQGEKPPVEPVEATQHTTRGAKAFAAFFIKTIDWGYATTSSAYMRHYFQHSCIECLNVADALDRAAYKHRHFIGDRFHRIRAQVTTSPPVIVARFDVSSVELVDRHGHFVEADPALNNYRESITLQWIGDAWRVREMVPHA